MDKDTVSFNQPGNKFNQQSNEDLYSDVTVYAEDSLVSGPRLLVCAALGFVCCLPVDGSLRGAAAGCLVWQGGCREGDCEGNDTDWCVSTQALLFVQDSVQLRNRGMMSFHWTY